MRARAVIVTIALTMAAAGSCPASEPRPTADQQGEKILHRYRPTRAVPEGRRHHGDRRPRKGPLRPPPEPHDHSELVERLGDASISYLRIYWRGGISGTSEVVSLI